MFSSNKSNTDDNDISRKQIPFIDDKLHGKQKQTELYNKQLQYRNILTRETGSKIFNKNRKTREIQQCKNLNELRTLFDTMHQQHCTDDNPLLNNFDTYNAFMRKSQDLCEWEFKWEIFDFIQHKLLLNKYYPNKAMAVGRLYNNVFVSALQRYSDTKTGVFEMFKLWNSFISLCSDDNNNWDNELAYYPITLTQIISSCTMAGAHNQAKEVIDDIFENRLFTFNYNKKFQYKLWNAILNHFSKTKDFKSMEFYYKKMTEEYKIIPDDVTFNIRINGYARSHDICLVEQLFSEYIHQFNKYPGVNVFAALLNGYSLNGDVASCIEVLKLLLSKNNVTDSDSDSMKRTLPDINFLIFSAIFKSLMVPINSDFELDCNDIGKIKHNYGWSIVDYLLNEMEILNITPNEIIYGMIFTLCSNSFFDKPDLDRLTYYYKEMTIKYALLPQHTQLKNVLRSGQEYFEYLIKQENDKRKHNDIKQEKYKFVAWWKDEMKKYEVPVNYELKTLLIRSGCISFIDETNIFTISHVHEQNNL